MIYLILVKIIRMVMNYVFLLYKKVNSSNTNIIVILLDSSYGWDVSSEGISRSGQVRDDSRNGLQGLDRERKVDVELDFAMDGVVDGNSGFLQDFGQ